MNKTLLLLAALLIPSLVAAQAPTLNQTIAQPVNQGASFTFTCATNCGGGTWTVTGTNSTGGAVAAAGSIVAGTGVYTAPATVNAQQSYAGYQFLPNNHIYNTRVDSLAVDTGGHTFNVSTVSRTGGTATITFACAGCANPFVTAGAAYSVTVAGVTDSTFNGAVSPVTSSTAAGVVTFTYANAGGDTSSSGGTVNVPFITSAGTVTLTYEPSFKLNYVDGLTPTTSELFQYTPSNNGTYQFPAYPGGKVEGGWLSMLRNPTAGGDHHLDMVDTRNGNISEIFDPMTPTQCMAYISGSCTALSGLKYTTATYVQPTNGSTDAAGMFVQPLSLHLQELEQAVANAGTINHALRMTLQNGFICGPLCGGGCTGGFVWPATTQACAGGGIVPYGERFRLKSAFAIGGFSAIAQILLTQLKQYGIILADGGTGWQIEVDTVKYPAAIQAALNEIMAANIAPSNFEAVNETSDMITSASGECTCNRETVTYTTGSGSASVDVVLTGVTVAMRNDQSYFMAGTPPIQLVAYVNGSANTGLTWTMSPTVGTLGATGIYTAPGSEAVPTVTTITATSAANGAVAATQTLTVFPNPTIRLYGCKAVSPATGFLGGPICSTTYTDSLSNVWYPFTGDSGGAVNGNSFGGSVGGTDPTLYQMPYYPYFGGDIRFDFYVPNGTYQIVWKGLAQRWNASGRLMAVEAQGTIFDDNVDLFATYGYQTPVDFTLSPVTVSNNILSYVNRGIIGTYQAQLSSLQVTQTSAGGGTTVPAGVKIAPGVVVK